MDRFNSLMRGGAMGGGAQAAPGGVRTTAVEDHLQEGMWFLF